MPQEGSSAVAERRASLGARRGFTLVEMLVVIGIVVVLAALVFTGGWYARQRARVFQCTTNLQQLGVAIALYVNDYRAIPLVSYRDTVINGPKRPPSPPASHDAQLVLGDYVSTPSTFVCPVAHDLWGDVGKYHFNDAASGLTVTQVRCGAGRAVVMYDPLDYTLWGPHMHRYNALFLDGHVKAYAWIVPGVPSAPNGGWPQG